MMKRQAANWEKQFARHISNEGLISRIYKFSKIKNTQKLIVKTKGIQLENEQKT